MNNTFKSIMLDLACMIHAGDVDTVWGWIRQAREDLITDIEQWSFEAMRVANTLGFLEAREVWETLHELASYEASWRYHTEEYEAGFL